jgi:hypothetical protein
VAEAMQMVSQWRTDLTATDKREVHSFLLQIFMKTDVTPGTRWKPERLLFALHH